LQQTATSVTLSAQHGHVDRVDLAHSSLKGLCAWRVGNLVGEAPNWDAQTQTLLWIDVRAPSVLRLDPATNALTRWTLPGVVGAMGLAAPGSVVLALQHTLALLELRSGRLSTLFSVDREPALNRLNDGKVSPSGRWFVFGSMDDRPSDKQPKGALYAAAAASVNVRLLHEGLTVANGIAFSPDAATIYFSDSHLGRVWHAPWNEDTGAMGQPELLCSPDEVAGRPDGAAVDSDGDYWSAGVSAGVVNRFTPEGALRARIELPCRAPTMPCFGGPEGTDMYVTSLVRHGWTDASRGLDGSLIRFASDATSVSGKGWGS
jgi:sugar lactone lactonase YvrE